MTSLPHLTAATAPPPAGNEPSVAAAREALSQWGRYPWYDPAGDGLQPVAIVDPPDWRWLLDWLNFGGGGSGSWNWLQAAIWAAIGLLLALLVWFLLRAYRQRRKTVRADAGPSGGASPDDSRRYAALPEQVRRRSGLLEEARRQYLAGNFDEAMIYLFSYQLVCLDRNQRIRLSRGKTNRQYLRELAGRDVLQRLLAHSTVAFEDIFFGGQSIGRDRFESCWNQVERFEVLAGAEGGS